MRRLTIAGLAALLALTALVAGGERPGPAEASPQVTTVYWGPYTVNGFSDLSGFFYNMAKPCSDCYITGVVPNLEYNNGGTWTTANYVNGSMLHHFVIFNDARVDATCGSSPFWVGLGLGDRFYASGNERSVMALPPGYGYYIPPTAPATAWDINLHIHNIGAAQRSFRVATTFTWQPAADNLRDVSAIWLDEDNCQDSQYGVAAGYDDKHWDWTSTVEGRVVSIGGHVHDFGTSVAAEKVGTGEWLCASSAGYASGSVFDPATVASPPRPNNAGHPADAVVQSPGDSMYSGHIEEMTSCSSGGTIAPGDVIRLHTQYNATSGIPDVMGIMTAYLYDNCSSTANPDQADGDNDLVGDACDPDIDGDGTANGSDPEADGDLIPNSAETACGSDPNNSLKVPERLDGAFAGQDDDRDGSTDEALPGGAASSDCDGDGYAGTAESNVFMSGRDQDPCGIAGWPADFVSGGIPNSTNRVTLSDLTSFLAPVRRINTSPNVDAGFDVRWDLVPGAGLFAKVINISDLTSLVVLAPPMLNNAKAFNGPVCPWPA